ncbi:RHS repeat domain-containing protein [uncultured Aquimarina sp.]|uniref:RHS repeat domain-containing protein n=1 Tax=uncultured Aquimarina sp. TaxID=575652 RepID=UPI0026216B1D|nr:RHS repeat domain-containing protein [uncultured Aquimarina sp.]
MKKVLLLICLLLSVKTIAQVNYNNKLPTVMPVGPTAYEFLKYEEIPISKYTGVPNISIPIYNIEAKGLNIPIALSYHSNGFKVSEEAGWSGLGWTLNEGGSIVQIVNGFDDFGFYSNRDFPDIDAIVSHASGGASPSGILDNCTGTVIGLDEEIFSMPSDGDLACKTSPIYQLPTGLLNGEKDFEPDLFKFNFLGYSGEFLLNWETGVFECLSDNKIKIEQLNNGFRIIVPEGHIFEFELLEESVFVVSESVPSSSSNVDLIFRNEKASRTYKIKDIYTNKNDHIHYSYEVTAPIKNYINANRSHTSYDSQDPNIPGVAYAFYGVKYSPSTSLSVTMTEQPLSYVSEIRFNNGKVVFNTSNRIDLVGAKKLDQIKVMRKVAEESYIDFKSFDFDYNYFVGHSNGSDLSDNIWVYETHMNHKTPEEFTHRLKLNSITEQGKNPYIFDYYEEQQLPKKTSLATDYWGYYNGYLNNESMFPNIYRFNKEIGYTYYQDHVNNNKSPRENYCKTYVLENITFPTKGYTAFTYELNSFENEPIPDFEDGYTRTSGPYFGAGLRIKEINTFDHNNSKKLTKAYEYQDGKLINPISFFNKTHVKLEYILTGPNSGSITFPGNGFRKTLKSSNSIAPSLFSSGNYVGYTKVIEYHQSSETNSESNGSVEEVYVNNEDEGKFVELSGGTNGKYRELNMPLRKKNTTNNGSLLEQYTYNKEGDTLKRIENSYHLYRSNCFNGIKTGPVYETINCDPHLTGLAYNSKQILGVYPIRAINSYKKNSVITDYYQNNTITTTEVNEFNSYSQIIENRIIKSNGDVQKTLFYHPMDFNTSDFIIYMKLYNWLDPLIKKQVLLNDKLLYTEKFNYKLNSTTVSPRLTLQSYEFGKGQVLESDLEEIINYHSYDVFGNITEISKKNGAHVVYVWGYNKTYPIAKIENASLLSMNSSQLMAISEAENVSNSETNTITENNLRSTLQTIRSLFPNSMVTTYTYDLLIGITSITDPLGYTMTYHYDDLNRLKFVKDADGNLVSENQYNYKN